MFGRIFYKKNPGKNLYLIAIFVNHLSRLRKCQGCGWIVFQSELCFNFCWWFQIVLRSIAELSIAKIWLAYMHSITWTVWGRYWQEVRLIKTLFNFSLVNILLCKVDWIRQRIISLICYLTPNVDLPQSQVLYPKMYNSCDFFIALTLHVIQLLFIP